MPYKDPVKKREYNKKYAKLHYIKNKDKILERQKEWKNNNSERVKFNNSQWRKNNKEKACQISKNWYKKNSIVICNKKKQERKLNPSRTKFIEIKCKYGISEQQYNSLFNNQNKRCKICKSLLNKPYIDHDHSSGIIRGLLCNKCNSLIGCFFENINNIQSAILYLENFENDFNSINLTYKYGESKNKYIHILENQNNKCKICKSVLDKPCIDHDHQSGKVRGYLCFYCNLGLGFSGDNKDILKNSLNYLKKIYNTNIN
jgi:hypothetical protein